MSDMIRIPFNDVFFYGIALRKFEETSAESDIFANIIMRYLRTLEPVSNRLYRTAEGNRFEYSYSFIPTRPLSWRVIKNKRVIEDLEHLSEGKYCLSYYDDQGRDVKRVIFDKGHNWLKTNYYNSIYGNTLLSSVVPKELNGETVILEYLTGATYPITHYCCKKASCKEVEERVFNRAPLPEISALTNYGVLFYAAEETLNIYNQVLEEEEEKYAQEHKPPVYTTDEDIASGFCFSQDSFESGGAGVFSLDEASELTDDDALFLEEQPKTEPYIEANISDEAREEPVSLLPEDEKERPFDIDADISAALEIIRNATNVEIDSSVIFADADNEHQEEELEKIFDEAEKLLSSDVENSVEVVSDKASDETSVAIASEIIKDIESEYNDDRDFVIEMNPTEDISNASQETSYESQVDLLAMEDEEIDDYVKTLIDSLLSDAKAASEEYVNSSDEGFETENEISFDAVPEITALGQEALSDADAVIESGREEYYFYGDYSKELGRNGRGRTLMADGKTAYEGEYRNDMRHGVGAFYYRSGELCYFGNWNENKRSGFGIGINSDTGISHTGNWAENKPNGIGVRFDKFGNFLYLDSHSERVNGGIRVTGFTENSLKIEYWDEKTLSVIKKEIFIDELNK